MSARLLGRWPLAGFLALACAWSWTWWIVLLLGLRLAVLPAAPAWRGVPDWAIGAALLGGWGPSIAALFVTFQTERREGVRRLLRRCVVWRLGPAWYLVAWFLPPLMMAGGLALFIGFGNAAGPVEPSRWTQALLALGIALPAGPLGEELGWRGFMLPRMQRTLSAIRSSLVIGVVWCLWHAPLYWAPFGTTVSGAQVTLWAVTKYLAYVTGLSVVFTWLFNATGGSLLLVIILHLTVNADLVTTFFPHLTSGAVRAVRELSTIPLWGVAIVLIAVTGLKHRH